LFEQSDYRAFQAPLILPILFADELESRFNATRWRAAKPIAKAHKLSYFLIDG